MCVVAIKTITRHHPNKFPIESLKGRGIAYEIEEGEPHANHQSHIIIE